MVTADTGRHRAAVLTGIGTWLPPRIVTNDELARRLDTSDEWIRTRTGIGQRHVAPVGMSASDLAVEAGQRALKASGHTEVDVVLLATTTPDHLCPATAPQVAARLGLGTAGAFDISAMCSGFVYGLAVAAGLIATGTAQRILLIASEVYSSILDPEDRTTAPIFGDGAGAVVLRAGRADEAGALGPVELGSDGSLSDLIGIPAGGSRQRKSGVPAKPGDEFFRMQGSAVFRQAIRRMADSCRCAVASSGLELSLIDRLAAHQANARILAALAGDLGIPPEKCLSNIEHVANTSAASIPLLLADAARSGALKTGDRLLLTAFGGGLTWGSTTLVWPELDIRDEHTAKGPGT